MIYYTYIPIQLQYDIIFNLFYFSLSSRAQSVFTVHNLFIVCLSTCCGCVPIHTHPHAHTATTTTTISLCGGLWNCGLCCQSDDISIAPRAQLKECAATLATRRFSQLAINNSVAQPTHIQPFFESNTYTRHRRAMFARTLVVGNPMSRAHEIMPECRGRRHGMRTKPHKRGGCVK